MGISVKIQASVNLPDNAVIPQNVIGKMLEVHQLGRSDYFVVDSVEYETDIPGVVSLCISPAPKTMKRLTE